MKDGKIGDTIVDRTNLRHPMHVWCELVEIGNVIARRVLRLWIEGHGDGALANANLTAAQVRDLSERFAAAADELEEREIRPGARVEVAIEIDPTPAAGFLAAPYPVKRGDRGWVARIIHCRIEGEPVDGPTLNPIVHVRFDNQTKVLAFARECLRVVDDPSEHP